MKRQLVLTALLLFIAAGTAGAVDVQNFQPALGTQNLLTLYSSTVYASGQFGLAVLANYAADPFTLTFSDDKKLNIVERMATGELQASVGLFDVLDIGVAGNFNNVYGHDMDVRFDSAFPDLKDQPVSGLGDLRAAVKVQILKNKPGSIGLALVPLASFPTGDSDAYFGAGALNAGGRLVLDKRFDRVNVVINGGYIYMGDGDGPDKGFDPSSRAEFGAGITIMAHNYVELLGEIFGRTVDYNIDDIASEIPIEGDAAIKLYAGPVHFILGGGAGVSPGIGNPKYRGFAGVALTIPKQKRETTAPAPAAAVVPPPDPKKMDSDRDGLSDYDETEVLHTDPLNPDTDGDGLPDGVEVNQYHTDPLKADTDGDGLSDGTEVHLHGTDPLKADTDGDGLSDGQEINVLRTNPLNPDTDGDGVLDGVDGAPLEPETDVYGYRDWDGVPEILLARKPSGVMMFEGRIVLPTALNFGGPQGAKLTKADKSLLQDVVTLLQEFPKIKLQIEGHFAAGTTNAMALSDERAQVVRNYLISRGVAANRLTALGQGDQVPIAPNTTPEGRVRNTRIDFLIISK